MCLQFYESFSNQMAYYLVVRLEIIQISGIQLFETTRVSWYHVALIRAPLKSLEHLGGMVPRGSGIPHFTE